MPTNDEEDAQIIKEFLSRAEIRTMKKDLRNMREHVALKEREKIVKIKEKPTISPTEKDGQIGIQEAAPEAAATEEQAKKEKDTMSQIKDFATEQELQQIFYLETERAELEKKLQTSQNEIEPPLLLKKNQLLLEKNDIQEKINAIAEEEKKVENEQKTLSAEESATNVPKDKQKLEGQRQVLEEERERIEKKRWVVEKELEKINEQIKITESDYQNVAAEQKTIRDKIKETNDSLRAAHVIIMQREEGKIREKKEKKGLESLEQAQIESKRKEDIQRKEWTGEGAVKNSEEEDRKKFIQDIDEWAKEPSSAEAPEDKDINNQQNNG